MSNDSRREWLELLVRGVVVAVMLAPLIPDSRTRWYLAMRACQETARRVGQLALVAENHYRQEIS